jgi:ring-1,2-phenylacetyl-CoA epoxidase subunit PaaE
MSKFTSLKIKDIIRETSDAVTVVFEKPSAPEFQYQAGQYLTLKVDLGGESLRRAYSLCSSPLVDADLAVTVKSVKDGRVSRFVNEQLQSGQTLEVFPPMGNFKVVPEATRSHHYVLLGGGSGITPLMSILKTVLKAESGCKVTLIYGNRDEQSIIFKKALDELESAYPDRLKVVHILAESGPSWTGLTGVPHRSMLLGLVQDLLTMDRTPKSYWICGPTGMMEEAQAALAFLGIPKEIIHREVFTAAQPDPEAKAAAANVAAKKGSYSVKVTLDGVSKEVFVKENATILDAVIDAGMDPPFACQMGVCCTCRAKLVTGKVQMDEDEGLSDTEISQGYILTCQAHPLTPDCELEYM